MVANKEYVIPNGVIDSSWKDEAQANSDDLEKEFALHPNDGKIIDPSLVKNATAAAAKEKIIKFRMEKFGERGSKIHSLFKQEKLTA